MGDSDEDNDGDDRQRLMRGTPTSSSTDQIDNQSTLTPTSDDSRPIVERRQTHIPVFTAPPPQTNGRVYGGGSGSDGVFANLSAKPERGEKLEEHPPTYEQAAADSAPPYWETTILAPGMGGPDEVYVDGLPVGSVFSFIWNGMISMSFQLVGFLLTYLLHPTRSQEWISCRTWNHPCSIWFLHEGFRRHDTPSKRPRPHLPTASGPQQSRFRPQCSQWKFRTRHGLGVWRLGRHCNE